VVKIDALRDAILTEEAENACELLMLSAAEHERFRRATIGWTGDPSTGANAALSYVVRCVIVVEMYTFQRVITLSDGHAAGITSPVFEKLYREHRKTIENSWANALGALEVWPGVYPKGYSEYPALRGYIQARNSWAHRHGQLTDRQLRELPQARKELTDAGFSLMGRYVTVRPDQVLPVARTCRSFVRKVDAETKAHLHSAV
jgi:hypothetical protein